VRDEWLKELAMPDLNQIKQGEQGARRARAARPATRVPQPLWTLPGGGKYFNPQARFRDFAADSLQRSRGVIAAAFHECGWPTGQGHQGFTEIGVYDGCSQGANRGASPAMTAVSRLDARPSKKYTSAFS